jgi:serine/threonine-protein kinase
MKECQTCRACFEDAVSACPEHGATLEAGLDGSPMLGGKYRLLRRLGKGGMGRVYRARQDEPGIPLHRDYAVKVIEPSRAASEEYLEQFRREARMLGRVRHDAIVSVTDSGVDRRAGGVPYIVTELLEGESLQDHVLRRGALSLEEALPILAQLASALDYLHGSGLVHGDVKPANVIMAKATGSETPMPKLVDFGLAGKGESLDLLSAPTLPLGSDAPPLPVSDSLAPRGGTPLYMAPEIVQGGFPTVLSDVYSFGVLAYVLLTRRVPFEEPGRLSGRGPSRAASSLNPALPEEADEILARALSPSPGERPPSASELVRLLGRADAARRARAWWVREWPRRAVAALVLGGIVAGASAGLQDAGWLSRWEGPLVDVRFQLSSRRPPDPRLVVLVIDEPSLDPEQPLAKVDGRLSADVDALFETGGARAVAFDLLLPEAWSRSSAFSLLVKAREDAVTLATFDGGDRTVGTEAVHPLVRTRLLGDWRLLFGLVNLETDGDDVVRRGRLAFPTRDGTVQASWPARAVRTLEGRWPSLPATCSSASPHARRYWIDYAIDVARIRRVRWSELRLTLEREPDLVRDKLVLVGGDLAGSGDTHRVPGHAGWPGISVQAAAVATALDGFRLRSPCPYSVAAVVLLLVASGSSFVLLSGNTLRALSIGAGLGAAYAGVAVASFSYAGLVWPLVAPLGLAALALLGATVLARLWPRRPARE